MRWSFSGRTFPPMGMERSPIPYHAPLHIQRTNCQRRVLDNVCKWMELCRSNLLHPCVLPAHIRLQPRQVWNFASAYRSDAKLVLPFGISDALLIMALSVQL